MIQKRQVNSFVGFLLNNLSELMFCPNTLHNYKLSNVLDDVANKNGLRILHCDFPVAETYPRQTVDLLYNFAVAYFIFV